MPGTTGHTPTRSVREYLVADDLVADDLVADDVVADDLVADGRWIRHSRAAPVGW